MNNTACIIRPHYAGLWSLINNVATCAELYDRVHVGWFGDDPNLIYKGGDRENLWQTLFGHGYTCEQFQKDFVTATVITNYPNQHLTYKHVAAHYTNPTDPWRQVYHRHWCNWRVRDEHAITVAKYIQHAFGMDPYVAALVRSDAHAGEQPGGKSQTLEAYRHAIENARREYANANNGHLPGVYIACGDYATLGWFQQRMPGVAHYMPTRRARARDAADFHLSAPQTFQDAINCLVEVMILSQAVALVHPVSNMATGALYINPACRSIYLP